jgi:hypothetical protein
MVAASYLTLSAPDPHFFSEFQECSQMQDIEWLRNMHGCSDKTVL